MNMDWMSIGIVWLPIRQCDTNNNTEVAVVVAAVVVVVVVVMLLLLLLLLGRMPCYDHPSMRRMMI